MREIKFRVRHYRDDGIFIVAMSLDLLRISAGNEPHRIEVLGQFTGLIDENGKEIYEGDIVTFYYEVGENDFRDELEVVKWDTENACFMFGDDICMLDGSRIRKLEVIGNIYENPELIKKPQ
jgi:hypothetical protein